eukprot:Gregarina_sp_Poly_1__3573@NODE_2046_length_2779_cov_104_156342_g1320_i0_p1_GENE_NODE_2046_length_2779_cov_104_156342_g1320_i0NODE_2046_length_2779_cov_104_156342_g1320_i0_p1_ORF_typecomplete_len689_score90_16_NODE_2046_length_2779_cov_104_156342_g1320_i0612067
MYAVTVISRLSKPAIPWKKQVILQELLGQLVSLLREYAPHELSALWDQIQESDISTVVDDPKQTRFPISRWLSGDRFTNMQKRECFRDFFEEWQEQHCSTLRLRNSLETGSEGFSRELAVEQRIRLIALEEETKPELSKDVSLFLALLSETRKVGNFFPIQAACDNFEDFFEWLDNFAAVEPLLCTRIISRYFVFEFLRLHPETSSGLSRACGWNSEFLLENIWGICRRKIEDIYKRTYKPIFDEYLAALLKCNQALPQHSGSEGIPMEQFQLFCKLRSLTETKYWSDGHRERWERILFGDKILENAHFVKTPELLRSEQDSNSTINWIRKRFLSKEDFDRKLYALPKWEAVWPKVLEALRTEDWTSKEWLLILAIGSVDWEITGSAICESTGAKKLSAWKKAAVQYDPFWKKLLSIEKKALRCKAPILGRVAVRYAVLQMLVNFPSHRFGGCNTMELLKHMWDCTESIRNKKPSSSDCNDAVTREEFRCLTETEKKFLVSYNKVVTLREDLHKAIAPIIDSQVLALIKLRRLRKGEENEFPVVSTSAPKFEQEPKSKFDRRRLVYSNRLDLLSGEFQESYKNIESRKSPQSEVEYVGESHSGCHGQREPADGPPKCKQSRLRASFAVESKAQSEDDFASAEFLKWLDPVDDTANQFEFGIREFEIQE